MEKFMNLFDTDFFENQYSVVFNLNGEQRTERLMAPVFTLNSSYERRVIFKSTSTFWRFFQTMAPETEELSNLELEAIDASVGDIGFIGAVKL
jgi:hypothetical protein